MKVANDLPLKIHVVGGPGVGKSSLISQYVYREFQDRCDATMEAISHAVNIEFELDQRISIEIYDIPKQSTYADYKNFEPADVVIAVVDITKINSLTTAETILDTYADFPSVKNFALVTNKNDLKNLQSESMDINDVVNSFKNTYGKKVMVYHVSAKTGVGVVDTFDKLIKQASSLNNKTDETTCCFSFKKIFNDRFFNRKKVESGSVEEMQPLSINPSQK